MMIAQIPWKIREKRFMNPDSVCSFLPAALLRKASAFAFLQLPKFLHPAFTSFHRMVFSLWIPAFTSGFLILIFFICIKPLVLSSFSRLYTEKMSFTVICEGHKIWHKTTIDDIPLQQFCQDFYFFVNKISWFTVV